VPNQSGDGQHLPHLTVSVDMFDHLRIFEAEPFDVFTVQPASVATSATVAPPGSFSGPGPRRLSVPAK
jgi:hypothetical protein